MSDRSASSDSSTDTADSDERMPDECDCYSYEATPINPPIIGSQNTGTQESRIPSTPPPLEWQVSPSISKNLEKPAPDVHVQPVPSRGSFKFGKWLPRRKISPEPVKRLRLLIYNALQIVTATDEMDVRYLAGSDQTRVVAFADDQRGGVGLAVDTNGIIEFMGNSLELKEKYEDYYIERYIDASKMTIMPGFIDAHSHPIWAGDRLDEYKDMLEKTPEEEQRKYKDYEGAFDISVNTMHTDDKEIYASLVKRLKRMVKSGTVYVECKSGYGILCEEEIRLLKLLNKAKEEFKDVLDMSITYFGGHIRPGFSVADATREMIFQQIPEIIRLRDEEGLQVHNIDVYCDPGVYGIAEARHILEAGQEIGLSINFHADELSRMGSAEMGAELGARAMSCLQRISNRGVRMMAESGSVAVLLPASCYMKRQDIPNARKLIRRKVPVALGSDYCPSMSCYSMPMVMYMACVCMGMSLEEAFIGATLNAAATIDNTGLYGAVAVGKYADLVLIKAPRWEHIIWQFGCHHDLINFVIKKGKIVKCPHQDSANWLDAHRSFHDDIAFMEVSD